ITLTRTNFTGAVTLSLGGAPSGVTGSFSPAAPTGTSSTLTLNVGSAVTPGDYPLTINGTSGAGARSTKLALTVGPAGSGHGTLVFCPPTTGKTINGSVANAGATDITTVSLGGRSASVFSFGASTFQLGNVPDGAQDLVAYDHSLVGGAESAIIRRSQNIADN